MMDCRRIVARFCLSLAVAACPALADTITGSADAMRTGWYSDQPKLSPSLVGSAAFTQLFSRTVTGQVYAQPLLANGQVFVATQDNWIYGIEPDTGAIEWSRNLGTPWNTSDIGCSDITPHAGITGTPVIDTATKTAYLVKKTYVSGVPQFYMHAVSTISGAERAGFPVLIQGTAQNAPSVSFDAKRHVQRPALLLMNGVVYAGFGGFCDISPWRGWIFGVSTAGVIKTRWVGNTSGDGAAIWNSGGGLVSDTSGQIIVATGNGGAPSVPGPGTSPPADLGESVARLVLQSDGSLRATDFFAPDNAATLDQADLDLGCSAPIALPAQFGTTAIPRLLLQSGKQGKVWVINRDSFGGFKQGAGGTDGTVQVLTGFGGHWSRFATWPGDGGYVYMPTESNGTTNYGTTGYLRFLKYGTDGLGKPTFTLAASSPDAFGFGTGGPVVTSDATTAGSAMVWVVWSPNANGVNSELRAYEAVPNAGSPVKRYTGAVSTSTKFSVPGIGIGRVYVGTRDGKLLGFGLPAASLKVTRTASAVHLSWTGNAAPYTLKRAEDPQFTVNPTTLLNRSSATFYDDPVVSDHKTYFYRVD